METKLPQVSVSERELILELRWVWTSKCVESIKKIIDITRQKLSPDNIHCWIRATCTCSIRSIFDRLQFQPAKLGAHALHPGTKWRIWWTLKPKANKQTIHPLAILNISAFCSGIFAHDHVANTDSGQHHTDFICLTPVLGLGTQLVSERDSSELPKPLRELVE